MVYRISEVARDQESGRCHGTNLRFTVRAQVWRVQLEEGITSLVAQKTSVRIEAILAQFEWPHYANAVPQLLNASNIKLDKHGV